jgi:hypothetical protein
MNERAARLADVKSLVDETRSPPIGFGGRARNHPIVGPRPKMRVEMELRVAECAAQH